MITSDQTGLAAVCQSGLNVNHAGTVGAASARFGFDSGRIPPFAESWL